MVSSCKDANFEENPTCGWKYDSNGGKIQNSQGFCCSCSLQNIIGISKESTRANLNCKLFGNLASSAHCLRFSDLIYHSFTLGLPMKQYTISIKIYSKQKLIVSLSEINI